MSSYNNSRPDSSLGTHRIIIYHLIKLNDQEPVHSKGAFALTCGLQKTSRNQRTRSAAVRGLDKHSPCAATALVTRGTDCRHFQTKQNDCACSPSALACRVLPSLFSRIWTVSPISRMRAWHIGDRKLQITVREKKDKKIKHTMKIEHRKHIYITVLL